MYMQAGVYVFCDQGSGYYLLADVLSHKVYRSENSILKYDKLHTILELRSFGLALPDRFLVQTMGKQDAGFHFKQRELHFNKWREQQFGHKDFPLMQLNKALQEVGRKVTVKSERDELKQKADDLRNIDLKMKAINELKELKQKKRQTIVMLNR